MYLSCTVFEIYRDIGRKPPIWTYPTSIWRSCWRWIHWNFARTFGTRKLVFLGYCTALFVWSIQSYRHLTGKRMDRHTMAAYTTLA